MYSYLYLITLVLISFDQQANVSSAQLDLLFRQARPKAKQASLKLKLKPNRETTFSSNVNALHAPGKQRFQSMTVAGNGAKNSKHVEGNGLEDENVMRMKQRKYAAVLSDYKNVALNVDVTRATFRLNERFLSYGMDSNLIRNRWQSFDLSNVRLRTLAAALGPAYMRLMGTDGDRMTFDPNCNSTLQSKMQSFPTASRKKESILKNLFPSTNFTMGCQDWDLINNFTAAVGWRLLFGFNNQLRKDGHFDPSNAISLLDYSIKKGFAANLDFELGNEPDGYPYQKGFEPLSGRVIAKDFIALRALLNSSQYNGCYGKSVLAGPDLGSSSNVALLSDFLDAAGDSVDAVTWHQYYGGTDIGTVAKATDPKILDSFPPLVSAVMDVVRQSPRPGRKVWLGETSSSVSPVGSNLYETYAAGFMLLDKLGMSARNGIDVVIRQTFIGFWFALVDLGMEPTPNYWISLLFKRLVGQEVLYVHHYAESTNVRFYAHCTNTHRSGYPAGAVTVYGMNLFDEPVTFSFPQSELATSEIHEYLLSPYGVYTGLTAKYIALNGKIVLMPSDSKLPDLKPVIVSPGTKPTLPGKALAFYVFPHAQAKACY